MASGSIELSSGKAWAGRIDWSSTAYENGNYSLVNAYVYTWKTDGYTTSGGGWFNGSVTIGGSSQDISYEQQEKSEQYVGGLEGIRVNHSSDGSGSVKISCSITKGSGTSLAYVTLSGSETVTLDTNIVGGASTATWRKKPVTIGEENIVDITSDNWNFTHELYMELDGASYYLSSGVSSTAYITIPDSYADKIRESDRKSCNLICYTYNGSRYIGQSKTSFDLVVPARIAPSVSIAVTDPSGLLQEFGAYIQTQSKAKVEITPSLAYNSRITSTETTCGLMVSYESNWPTFDLSGSGQIQITTTVTDARGHSGSTSATITVQAYALPLSRITSVYRCDSYGNENDQGDHAMIVFNGNVDPLTYTTAKYELQYREQGVQYWTDVPFPQYDGWQTVTGAEYIFPAEKEKAYEVCIKVYDRFVSAGRQSAYRICPQAFVMMHMVKSRQAFGFGQSASVDGTILMGLPVQINKGCSLPEYRADTESQDTLIFDSIIEMLPYESMFFPFLLRIGPSAKYACEMFKVDANNAFVLEYSPYSRQWKIQKKDGVWGTWE